MIFNSIFNLVGKDLRIFFRSSISAIIILILPLLIVLLAGYGFNSNSLSGVAVGAYSEGYSNVSENILDQFEQNGFSTHKYPDLNSCLTSVKSSDIHVCVFFPSNLSFNTNSENIIFYVDYSRTNLAYTLINIISEDVFEESSEIGTSLVQKLLDDLYRIKNSLSEEKIILTSVNSDLENIENLTEEIDNSSVNLDLVIKSLEDFENASKIRSEISSLENLSEIISKDFEEIKNVNEISSDLQLELDALLINLDKLELSLNSMEMDNAEGIVSPIKLEIESIIPETTKREYLLPTIFALISLFGAILISSTFVLKNKKTRAYFRNFVTPTRDFTFILSTYFTSIIILLIQFTLVFGGIYFIFGMNFLSLPFEMISILVLGWSVFIFIGMFLGYGFRSEEAIIFSSVLVSSILMFFSNLILPLENISNELFRLTQFNPFVILESTIKKIYLFGLGFESIWFELIILASFLLVFAFLTLILRKLTKRRL